MRHAAEIDEGFIGRVYRTSVFVWGFVTLVMLSLSWFFAAAGWTVGSAVSLGVLWSLERTIRRDFVPGNERARSGLVKRSVAALAAVVAVLVPVAMMASYSSAFIFAFVAGVVLTQAVISLKVLGMLICQYFND